jgi:hypothetical protein
MYTVSTVDLILVQIVAMLWGAFWGVVVLNNPRWKWAGLVFGAVTYGLIFAFIVGS